MPKPYTRVSYVLIILTLFFLIFGAAATVLLFLQPDARSILTVDFPVIAAWVALITILYIVALVGIFKRQRWGAVVAGVTAILDVIAGFFVFAEVSTQVAYLSELAITVFAYLEYQQLSAA
jgi:uncharacterized membrane protein YGL010W